MLDAAVQGAEIELPDALVEARAREVWDQMVHTLSHQGISKEAYLRIAGKEEDEIVEEGKADAAQALRRDAVLAAIVEAEGIEPSDDEVRAAVEQAAGEEGTSPRRLMDRLRSTGRLDQLRADLAQRAAMELLTESATADLGRPGEGARGALDARQRGRGARRRAPVDARELTPKGVRRAGSRC